ncbi:hypothetical protein JTB14_006187 [Gonioctena quinquepunctata]|nr:hypothetical protein JTB14_006187 [Gonioctena quinquepunctata]
MLGLEEFCCICVKRTLLLENINQTNDHNVNYQHKLSVCVPDQKWYEYYNICRSCIAKLESAYDFIQICLHSEDLRKKQLVWNEQNESKKVVDSALECTKYQNDLNFEEENDNIVDPKSEMEDIKAENPEDPIENVEDNSNYSSDSEVKPLLEIKKKYNKRKNPLACEYCGKIFHRRQHYSAHIRAKHTFEKPYQCDICDAKYTNSHSLLVHKRNHNNEKPFICSYCGKSFVCSGDLYHHSKIHLNKREYKCNLCEKSFNTASILRTHKICMHTEPKDWKYVCSYCSKRFPINSSLATHLKRHTGIKECSCHICEKKFFDKSELTKHLRSHSSERLFKCNICEDKEYKNHYGLRKHMKIIHDIGTMKIVKPEKKFLCPMCPKIFAFNNKLQKHLCTHTGEKPFKCSSCDKKFIDNYYRKIHLKKKHNIELTEEYT